MTIHYVVSDLAQIDAIRLEQSVEMPFDTLPPHILESIVGKVVAQDRASVSIHYPNGNIGGEITQFLNILFGNISLLDGIRITGVDWDELPPDLFGGPRFGLSGMRERLGVPSRPLSCTALKPVGSTPAEFAAMAYEFAMGGIDMIKDDHGLANQPYAPFLDRLRACADAVNEANATSGGRSVYVPHITGPGEVTERRFEAAVAAGAGAVLVCPHLTAPDVMHRLARRDDALPIMAHPAFSGGLVGNTHGFTRDFLYGALWRALGADFVIYPNTGGRFTYPLADCLSINEAARRDMNGFAGAWPTPGGGMQRATLHTWIERYGNDTCYLIGGSLYQHPDGLRAAASDIRNILESAS